MGPLQVVVQCYDAGTGVVLTHTVPIHPYTLHPAP